ncbi:MAG: sulfatase [Planctomycetota bacterium]
MLGHLQSRQAALLLLSTVCVFQIGQLGFCQESSRPNILLIMADDLGWKDLHCYGNQRVDTPVLDQLARNGIQFSDAYSAAPVCTPTRAALMTGESPARLHITNHAPGHKPGFQKEGVAVSTPVWQRYLPLERVTLAEQLRGAGYATGFVGKWHLSHRKKKDGKPTELELRPEYQGFDLNVGGCDYGGPPSYFEPFRIPSITVGDEPYLPERCANECVEFMRGSKEENKPFFLCWWNYSVHYPFEAPEELIKKYEAKNQEAGQPKIKNPTYAAMIEGMDQSIGTVLDGLEKLGLAENTLVIFTSDNGPFAADVRPLRGEKGYVYEGGIRVPLMIRWPGKVQAGQLSAEPVMTMDLHRSVLDAVNVKPDPTNAVDGVSLLPLVTEGKELGRSSLFFHYPNYAFHKKNRMGSVIRRGKHKLIRFYDDASTELYDLSDDISEKKNLVEDKPELAASMQTELEEWLTSVDAQIPTRD